MFILLFVKVTSSIFETPSNKFVVYRHLWHTVADQKFVIFKVRACSDAHILLARYFGVTDYDVYEIWLGKSSNSLSTITVGISGTILAQQATNQILHCTHSRWFWIDWSRGITVGNGPLVGDLTFLNISAATLPRVFDISTVAVDTGPNESGDWEFSSVPGMYVIR